jgi:hypothetical protein
VRDFFHAAAPFASGGVSVNFLTAGEGDRVRSAYGPNYDRLAGLKRKYDPETSSGEPEHRAGLSAHSVTHRRSDRSPALGPRAGEQFTGGAAGARRRLTSLRPERHPDRTQARGEWWTGRLSPRSREPRPSSAPGSIGPHGVPIGRQDRARSFRRGAPATSIRIQWRAG